MAVFTPMTSPFIFKQRPAGVAGINGRVSLNEVLELAAGAGLDGPVLGGDDAGGDGLLRARRGYR